MIQLKKETVAKLLQLIRDRTDQNQADDTFPRPNNIQFIFIEGAVSDSPPSESSSSSDSSDSDSSDSSDGSPVFLDCTYGSSSASGLYLPTTLYANIAWTSLATSTFGTLPSCVPMAYGQPYPLYQGGCATSYTYGATVWSSTIGGFPAELLIGLDICACYSDLPQGIATYFGQAYYVGGNPAGYEMSCGYYDPTDTVTWFDSSDLDGEGEPCDTTGYISSVVITSTPC